MTRINLPLSLDEAHGMAWIMTEYLASPSQRGPAHGTIAALHQRIRDHLQETES